MNSIKIIEGDLNGEGSSFAFVVSRFNSLITERLLEGGVDCLLRHGVKREAITVVRVPGAWEIPAAARRLAGSGDYSGVVCLGAVIRGGTPHFDYVAGEVSKGVASVGFTADVAVTFGVLTTDTIEQAVERAGTKAGNKGWEAAESALEMVNLFRALE